MVGSHGMDWYLNSYWDENGPEEISIYNDALLSILEFPLEKKHSLMTTLCNGNPYNWYDDFNNKMGPR